jgi:hypothetical protein
MEIITPTTEPIRKALMLDSIVENIKPPFPEWRREIFICKESKNTTVFYQ